ncbi:hypothetical protein PoB_007177400 [Plakobranchus ocellatus]|uniref:Uncharacterized protein n=1 Tax=Plakobranchus ocellatus TaxID=259542 RepID=A0AAV4DMQ7_9GAST|nr:hypothetical protein PoB_007177400 [Plakobranchus ocellatus]
MPLFLFLFGRPSYYQEIIDEDDVFVLGGMVLRMNSSEYKAYVENEGWSDEASEASDEDDGVLDLVADGGPGKAEGHQCRAGGCSWSGLMGSTCAGLRRFIEIHSA